MNPKHFINVEKVQANHKDGSVNLARSSPMFCRMTYYLNNVRKKGMGGSHFPTSDVVTVDVISRYVFRSDVAYDWDFH